MSQDLIILGSGALAREVAHLVRRINRSSSEISWALSAFVTVGDDDGAAGAIDGCPVITDVGELARSGYDGSAAVAAGDPEIGRRMVKQVRDVGMDVHFPVLVDPSVQVECEDVEMAEGVIVFAGCVFSTGIRLGAFTFVNALCFVGHDVETGSFCRVMPHASLLGGVYLGRNVYVGAHAAIMQYKVIGDDAKVSMGSVVSTNVGAGEIVGGNPARVIKRTGAAPAEAGLAG